MTILSIVPARRIVPRKEAANTGVTRTFIRNLTIFVAVGLGLSDVSRAEERPAAEAVFVPTQAASRVPLPSDLALPPLASPPAQLAVEPTAAAIELPATTDPTFEQLQRRLVDVEGQLKKRDEADKKEAEKKKATEFPSFKLSGFTQFDGVWYDQDPTNIATVGNAQDGVGLRRVRLGATGKVAEFTNYMTDVEFVAAGKPSLFDVWAEQGNLPLFGTVRFGHFRQPVSVDSFTGQRIQPFLERSLPFLAFVPFRRVGVMAYNQSADESTQWAYSVYKTGGFGNAPFGDSRYGTDIGDENGYGCASRATHLFLYDDPSGGRYLWHVGGSAAYGRLGANTAAGSPSNVPFYQARALPEFGPLGSTETTQNFGQSFAFSPVFVDTGRFPADSYNLYGIETVVQRGAFSLQSEFMATMVDSAVGNVFYHGAYAGASYRLTGEHRPYDKKVGTLGKVLPFEDFITLTKGRRGIYGWGAWELTARYSYVSLHNPTALNGRYLGGTSAAGTGLLQDTTVGLNWYWNANTRLMFEWIHAMLDNTARGYSQADLFATRFHIDF